MIRLRVLGPLDLRDDEGREFRNVLAQPKRVALLATLVIGPPGFRRRDSILAMLWPEQDQGHARAALNQALRFLRKELGGSTEAGILSRGADEIGIDSSTVWCDAMEFRNHVEAGRYKDALALYRGNLLDGFFVDDGASFQEWLDQERELLKQTASRVARAVVGIHESEGDLTPAVAAARQAVALADGDERVLRELLQLLDRLGDRAGALQAYQEFARKLQTEFGVSPAPETQAVVEDIRQRRRVAHDGVNGARDTQSKPVSDRHEAENPPTTIKADVAVQRRDQNRRLASLPLLLLQRSPWVIVGVAIGVGLAQCRA